MLKRFLGIIAYRARRPGLASLLICVGAFPAIAEVRDQVETNATRCAVIGDDRQWLDCYYGAAQPLRAALGLKAATDAQLRLIANPPAGTPATDSAAVRNIVLRNAFGCGMDQEQKNWLSCFYAAAEPMRARLGLASFPRPGSTVSSAVRSAPVRPIETRKGKPPPGREVTARMASYSFDKSGIFTVTLDNGQVWRQVASDASFAHWHARPDRLVVKVSKGFWGSFNLEVSGQSGLYKVRRVE